MKVPKPRRLKSGTWFIQLRLGGESIPVTGMTERECVRSAQLIKAEHIAGKRDPKQADPQSEEEPTLPTLNDAIDYYIAKRDAILSPSTIRGYRTIQKFRFQSLMPKPLSDISDNEWQTACNIEAKSNNCSAKTLKNAWGFIASVIMDSTGEQPPKVKLPQVIPNERPFLEPEQIKTFVQTVHGKPVEIPALLALHSLRRSEILALRWENIDFKNRIIKVRGATVPNEDGRMVSKKENKNASSTRDVPILIDELFIALQSQRKDSGLVVECFPNTIYIRINKLCEKEGLPKVGVHGLRHSFVSLAYHLGVPEKVVMEIGGWSDYQTMRKIYTHIAKSDVTKYTSKISNFFSSKAENAN